MANESVATLAAVPGIEPDPYERIRTKLNGLQAVATLANVAVDDNSGVTDQVWSPLWYFIAEMCDELNEDVEAFRRAGGRQ